MNTSVEAGGRRRSRTARTAAKLWLHGAVLAAAALIPVLPPGQGPMLVVPVLPGANPAQWAVAHDARLVGLGPLPGSLIVDGKRDRMMMAALSNGFLLVSANSPACSASAS
ncbi:hypothetical protein E2493_14005 [Sphingomonas parva]|uniref:Uncharacterized protein n=1 Tax=Sphingomonas parva TaxID=2555898 RepID=A0A4Y8ZNU2_9SPHN|nr:hypothetical protein [Sphingomonas parva]TFI57634.1 hypothetical protein E2493_14005 [Sphingomonas parva]